MMAKKMLQHINKIRVCALSQSNSHINERLTIWCSWKGDGNKKWGHVFYRFKCHEREWDKSGTHVHSYVICSTHTHTDKQPNSNWMYTMLCILHHKVNDQCIIFYICYLLYYILLSFIHSFMPIYAVLEKRAIFSSLLNMRVTKSNCSCVNQKKKNNNKKIRRNKNQFCGSALCFNFFFLIQFFRSFIHSFFSAFCIIETM